MSRLSQCLLWSAMITAALMFGADGVTTSAQTNPTPLNLVSAKPLMVATTHTDGRGTPKLVFSPPSGAPSVNDRKAADNFLKAHQKEFNLPADISNLEFISARESLLGTHYRYQQMLNGIPVEGAEIVVSINRTSGEIYQAYNNTYPVNGAPVVPKALIGGERALDSAWNHLRVHGRLLDSCRKELVYVPVKDGFRLVYKTYVAAEAPFGYWEHQIDAVSGEVVAVRDMAIRVSKDETQLPDFSAYIGPVWPRTQTTREWETVHARRMQVSAATKNTVNGTARVFDPDPRTALADETLKNSSSASAFTNAYLTRTLRDISETGGVYSLDGPWVKIVDFESPTDAPSTTTDGNWTASRGNNAFNDAMSYFHIDQNQRYLQSLGYTGTKGIQDGPIEVDSNGLNGDDNSHYVSVGNRLAFGHGGVDDNEDADVILHEYGHAITHDIVSTWGSGGDSLAIGEGFGDYWGASYSYTGTNGNTFHPEWAFSWDGHSADTWSGRFLNKTDLTYDPNHTNGDLLLSNGQHYPGHTWNYEDHETISGISNYSDQLWGTPLFQSFLTLVGMGYPRTDVDKIVIESYFGLGGNPTMREMATATVNAAELLYPTGSHADVFREKFSKQGILSLPSPAITANYSSLLLNPGQQQTLTFTIKNSGGVTGNLGGYLSLSLSAGLDIVGYSSDHDPTMQYSHKQPGEYGWNKNQQQIVLSYELLDAYQTYSAGETRKIYVTVKANANGYGSQWIKCRATFNDSQNHYVNDPATGGTDQQGWSVYQIAVDGGGVAPAGALLVNGSVSPSAMQISATSNGFSINSTVALKNSGGQTISVVVTKSGSKSAWISLNAPTSFTINSNSSKNFYFDLNVPAGTAIGNYSAQLAFAYSAGTIYLPITITVTQYQPGESATVSCTGVSSPYYVTQATPLNCSIDLSPYSDVIQNGLIPTKSKFKVTLGSNNGYPYYYLLWDGDNPSYYPEPRAGFYTTVGTDIYWGMEKTVGTVFSTRINDPDTTSPNHIIIRTTMGSEYNVSNPRYEFTAYDGDPNLKINSAISNSTCYVGDTVNISLAQTNSGTSPADERVFEAPVLPAGLQYSGAVAPGSSGSFIYPESDNPGNPDSETDNYSIKATIAGLYSIPGITINYENTTGTKNFKTSASPLTVLVSGGTAVPSVSLSSAMLKMGATETITVSVLDSISNANIPDAIVTGIITTPDLKTYQFYLNYNTSAGKYVKEFTDTLSTGTYALQVSAERSFYTTGVTVPSSFTVVSRPATQVVLAGTMGDRGWYKSDVNVAFSIAGGSPHIQTYYKLDDGAQQLFSAPFLITSEGGHTLEYWTIDADLADNDEIQHNTQYVFIDKSVPSSTCSALSPYNRLTFMVQWSGEDTGGSNLASYDVQYKTGVGEWTDWLVGTYLTFQNFGPALDGQTYYFRVRAKDIAGNVEVYPDTPDTFTTVDVSSPSVPVVTSPTHQAGVWNISSNNPQFNCTAADAGSGVAGYNIVLNRLQSFVPDMVINLTGNSTTFMNVADGIWYFHARAKDGAGNWGPATTYGPVKIDLNAPNFPGIASSKNPAKEGDITLTVIASEQMSEMTATIAQNGSGPISVPLTSQDSITWTGSYPVAGGFDGTATISVSGKDLSGKSGSGSATFKVDTIAPTKPIATSPTHTANIPVSNNIAAFTWSPSSDNSGSGLAGYSYAINQIENFNLDFTTETVSISFVSSALPDATYWFHLRAVDNAENGSVVERYKFIVDTTSPTFITSYSCNLCKAGTVSLTVTANEPLKQAPQVSVRQNGQGSSTPLTMTSSDNTLWIGGYTVVSGYDGTADVNVTGIDIATNTGTGSSSFQVDTIGPSASITLSPPAPLKTGPFALNLTIADAGGITGTPVLSYSPAGQQPVPVNLSGSNKSWTGGGFIESIRSTGTAIFSFSAVDAAGNEGTAVASGNTFVINTAVNGNTGGVVENSDGTNVVVGPGTYNGGLVINIGTPNKTLPGIVEANTNTPKVTPIENQDLYRECTAHDNATNSAVTAFSSPITITMYYPDANNDGIVDGSNIGESRLRLYWLNEDNKRWEEVTNAVPDFALKKFSASVTHFSIYSILAVLPTAGIYPIPWKPGAGGKFDSANVSGCGSGIIFDNLPSEAKISIYNYSGDLIRELNVTSLDNGCKAWNGKNSSGRDVASGIYLAVIKTSSGNTVKKLAIER